MPCAIFPSNAFRLLSYPAPRLAEQKTRRLRRRHHNSGMPRGTSAGRAAPCHPDDHARCPGSASVIWEPCPYHPPRGFPGCPAPQGPAAIVTFYVNDFLPVSLSLFRGVCRRATHGGNSRRADGCQQLHYGLAQVAQGRNGRAQQFKEDRGPGTTPAWAPGLATRPRVSRSVTQTRFTVAELDTCSTAAEAQGLLAAVPGAGFPLPWRYSGQPVLAWAP